MGREEHGADRNESMTEMFGLGAAHPTSGQDSMRAKASNHEGRVRTGSRVSVEGLFGFISLKEINLRTLGALDLPPFLVHYDCEFSARFRFIVST